MINNTSSSTVWAFDVGKASLGEAVLEVGTDGFPAFLHCASLLIPAELGSTQAAAGRRRMHRTRVAHRTREAWLDLIWTAAGLIPLTGRRVEKNAEGYWQPVEEEEAAAARRELLEREFPAPGDERCFTSSLLRIKLLRGEKLEPWQIYKALRASLQKRGYGRVAWAAAEAGRKGKTAEEAEREEEKQAEKIDAAYKAAGDAWKSFTSAHDPEWHFPCYYDAWKMGLWSQREPDVFRLRIDQRADSTRNVRFDRKAVEAELLALAREAARQLPELQRKFAEWKRDGFRETRQGQIYEHPVLAPDFAAFFTHGPAGKEFAPYDAELRSAANLRRGGSSDGWGRWGRKSLALTTASSPIAPSCPVFTLASAPPASIPRPGPWTGSRSCPRKPHF